MKYINAFPYRRPDPARVFAMPWRDRDGSKLESVLADWDPATPVEATRKVQLDVPGILEDCHLPDTARLRAAVTWVSSETQLRGVGSTFDFGFEGGDQRELELSCKIPAGLLSGRLRLRTAILLAEAADAKSPVAPSRVGSNLWVTEDSIVLEGAGARFPVTLMDFSMNAAVPDRAGWFLDLRDDPDLPFLGAVRLLVNQSHQRVAEAVTGSSPTEADMVIRSFMRFDVARALLVTMLESSDMKSDRDHYPSGSLGRTVHDLVESVFPGRSVATLRKSFRKRTDFNAELQDRLRLLGS